MEITGQPIVVEADRAAPPARRPDDPAWQVEQERAEMERTRAALVAANRRLELAARRQSELLAGMCDDLRTPIDSLLILAKLLADNEGNNLTPQQVDFAQTIYAAGSDVLSLVADIQDFARIESRQMTLDVAEQPFRELRTYLLRAFRHAALERHAAFEVVLAPELPAALRTDGKRLRHLMKNLLSLAFRSAHGGRVTLSIAASGGDAVFDIRRRAGEILGCQHASALGLSICRELAHSLGGEVQAASLQEGDLHLSVRMPMMLVPGVADAALPITVPFGGQEEAHGVLGADEAPQADQESRSRSADDAVMLIVEGNAQVASVMLDLVRANGYQGVVATDVGTMRVLLRELAPEAILIGGSLLDVDGWTTLELLKRDPMTRRVPISMCYFDAHRYICLQIGARAEWSAVAAGSLLGTLDAATGKRAARLLMAGVADAGHEAEVLRCAEGRVVRRVASGAAALDVLRREGADALLIGRSLDDMKPIDLIRTISAAGLGVGDLPMALLENRPAAPGTLEIAMLRQRARLEDVLGETALYLARSVGSRPPAGRGIAARRREASPELAGRKVLIVDDDIYNVYAMTGALEQQGMSVVLAENAREAIAILRDGGDIDAVLIDITMPEIDGDSVVHAMRATQEHGVPIIAVTPHAMPGDREKCIGAGASDYISKPVNVEQMLALLRTWLSRER